MSATWSEAPNSVVTTAQELIHKHHQPLNDLRIGFIFRSEVSLSQGITVCAGVSKVPDKLKVLLELDILIWIAGDVWRRISEVEQQALIDHQLCHIQFDGSLVGHDFEDFREIIVRYGLWNSQLFRSAEAFKKALQPALGLNIEPKGKVVSVQPDLMNLPTVDQGSQQPAS